MRLVLLAILALTACAPTEQQACASMGYEPGDPGFWTCMDHMERGREANMAGSAAMLQMGTMLLAPPPRMDVYVH